MNPNRPSNAPPKEVRVAMIMLYLQIGTLILRIILQFTAHAGNPAIYQKVFPILIEIFLVVNMTRGKNWARITFLIIVLLGTAPSVSNLTQTLVIIYLPQQPAHVMIPTPVEFFRHGLKIRTG
jgi:hypothetical protein